MKTKVMIRDLKEIDLKMIDEVGGKNASLGEMISTLSTNDINVPPGFAITVHAFDSYMHENGLSEQITALINELDVNDLAQLRKTGAEIRQLITNGTFPKALQQKIKAQYEELSLQYGENATDVAIRSSATAEDLPEASFAGQQDSFLNVRGAEDVISSIKS